MSRKKPNPVLQKKYEQGLKDGIAQAVDFFIDRFNGLENVPGIGEKTLEKIKKQLGEQYFK